MRILFLSMPLQLVFQLVLHVSFNSTSRVLVVLGITCYAMARRLLLLLLGIMFHTMTRQLSLLGMYFTIRE